MLIEKQVFEAVFISDLHLHPENAQITARFNTFIDWAANNTRSLYILGDFFHVWPGDDGFNPWSLTIAARLKWLSEQGITVYFMSGNRDFLIGKTFAKESGVRLLTEPAVIELDKTPILLVHGDRYCIKDKSHQRLRKLTRNSFFPKLFLCIPFKLRNKLVNGVRQRSEKGEYRPGIMDVVADVMLAHMESQQVKTLIHGHTHKPGLTEHLVGSQIFSQYILSDWDDSPQLLCYDKSIGFQFVHFQ